jgi:phage/plasmid-like protein (TIGR03299 family)
MSHNLKFRTDGSAVYASTTRDWHGLGEFTDGKAMTVADAMRLTGLDALRLVEYPMTTEVGPVSTHKSVYLEGDGDPVLVGVVGKDRKIFQPEEMLSPMDTLADASGGSIQSVGMLGKGERWFATVLFPEEWTLRGEKYRGYLFGRDSADGSSALDIRPTFIKVVCENTYNCALSATRGIPRYTVRHTTNAKVSVDAARAAIGMVPEYAEEFERALEALYEKDFTFTEFQNLTKSIFGEPDPNAKTTRSQTIHENRTMELARLWKADTQAQSYRNGQPTAQTAFDAIGEYLDWTYGSNTGRIDRQVMGQTARIKTQVLSALLPA